MRKGGKSDSVSENRLHRGVEEEECTAERESSVGQESSLGGGEGELRVRACIFVCMCYVVL